MNVFEPILAALQKCPFAMRSLAFHGASAAVLCSLLSVGAYSLVSGERGGVQRLHAALDASRQAMALPALLSPRPAMVQQQVYVAWPLRKTAEELVEQLAQTAVRLHVGLRALSVSHQAASVSALGSVVLNVSTTGSYASAKAWQAELMQRFPTLALKDLRLLAMPVANGELEAQWIWVLHVAD